MDAQDYEVFCRAASTGIALGLTHRYEWYFNAIRMLGHGDYEVYNESALKIDKAFVEFEKMTCSCPEEEAELAALTAEGLAAKVNAFYHNARMQHRSENDG